MADNSILTSSVNLDNVQNQLNNIGDTINEWTHSSFGHVGRKIKGIQEKLSKELLMWKQRSRVQADKNTKLFHAKASCRSRKNNIAHLKDAQRKLE